MLIILNVYYNKIYFRVAKKLIWPGIAPQCPPLPPALCGLQVKFITFIGFESLNSVDPAADPVTALYFITAKRTGSGQHIGAI